MTCYCHRLAVLHVCLQRQVWSNLSVNQPYQYQDLFCETWKNQYMQLVRWFRCHLDLIFQFACAPILWSSTKQRQSHISWSTNTYRTRYQYPPQSLPQALPIPWWTQIHILPNPYHASCIITSYQQSYIWHLPSAQNLGNMLFMVPYKRLFSWMCTWSHLLACFLQVAIHLHASNLWPKHHLQAVLPQPRIQ